MDFIIAVVVLLCARTATSALTTDCPAPPIAHCSCVSGDMECLEGHISLPLFSKPTTLNRLQISNFVNLTIMNSSFSDLTVGRLELTNNGLQVSDFQSNAFVGLTVDDIDLSHNQLQKIPDAIARITPGLKGLDVSFNSINSFASTAFDSTKSMKTLGSTLLRFAFGSSDITKWPRELAFFPRLEELNVTSCDITVMPFDAFYGFDKTLKKLKIENTNLDSVPLAIAQIDYLTELRFDHNHKVGDFGMNVPIVRDRLVHLGLLSLQDDNITNFPAIIGTFKNLTQVLMDENNLKFVSDKSAEAVKNVTYLSLRNASITRVPGALQDITTLEVLDLSNNNIHSLEREDLRNLTSLRELRMNNNPVLYISRDAFQRSAKLNNLQLNSTQLHKIPCALDGIPKGHNVTVDIGNNAIECTCELNWIRNLAMTIRGNCETIESTVHNYINGPLMSCPAGNLCKD